MSNNCKDTLQTQNKTVRVQRSRTSKVSIRYRRRQSCRNQESFGLYIIYIIFIFYYIVNIIVLLLVIYYGYVH